MAEETDRAAITQMLASDLKTEIFPRADTSEQFIEIQNRLREHQGDIRELLKIGGFTDHTITYEEIEQPCETCMYYLVRRKWCNLPELNMPAEAHWSCRLWRI